MMFVAELRTTAYPDSMPMPKDLIETIQSCTPEQLSSLKLKVGMETRRRYDEVREPGEFRKRGGTIRALVDKWLQEVVREDLLKDASGRN